MMKKIFFYALIFPTSIYAQQQSNAKVQKTTFKQTKAKTVSGTSNQQTSNNNSYPMTISSNNSSYHSKVGSSPDLTIEQINHTIKEIQKKIDYISADPVRKAEAEAIDWFNHVNQTISNLKQKKRVLLNN